MEYVVLVAVLLVIHGYLELVSSEHADLISDGIFIDHKIAAYKRSIVFFLALTLLAMFNFWIALIGVIMMLSYWWIIFDLRLNLKRGEDWDYVGENAEIDKWFRENFANNYREAMIVAKIISILCFGAALITYILRSQPEKIIYELNLI